MRDRAYLRAGGQDLLNQIMADTIIENLTLIKRDFRKCLVVGLPAPTIVKALDQRGIATTVADASFAAASDNGGIICDEDRSAFGDQSFDLIINIGALDTVNDLPGALALSLRMLQPDGVMMAAFIGAESLSMLKSTIMSAEDERVAAHFHPQIDIRTFGDLVSRVGFALPVIDSDTISLRYSELDRLVADIRDTGGTNILKDKISVLPKGIYQRAQKIFSTRSENDGKTVEKIEIVYFCGWAPHPDQPQPAKRGSGNISLKTQLERR